MMWGFGAGLSGRRCVVLMGKEDGVLLSSVRFCFV